MEGPTRRLAAVWFADIVGFTRLSSQDEAAALRVVELFQEIAHHEIEGYGGTIVKFTGDGLLAYSDSTASAIDASVALRATFHHRSLAGGQRSSLRIGIHLGDIVLSPDGDVYGDGVNVASRLQSAASPGGILVSEDVWRQCRNRPELQFSALGPLELKGLQDPVSAYELVSESPEEGAEVDDASSPTAEPGALAVLPFEVLAASDEAEFLAAGLHNDLLTELSKVPELTVISRTSVMGYRGTDKSLPRIAQELNAGTIIEGAVQSAGNRVRLTVQLIDAHQDAHRWAENYDRELTAENLFAIQTEVTHRIAESLHAQLASDSGKQQAGPATENLGSYRLVAQGRMELDHRTEASLQKAVEHFEGAIELDQDYALAWVGLADALAIQDDYGYGDRDVLLPYAEKAARRALELDPESAEAHTSLGLIHSARQNGPAAVLELERAVELQPSYADAHNWLSWVQQRIGKANDALVSAEQAVNLNPLSAAAVVNLAMSHLAMGSADRALVEAQRAGELSSFTTAAFYEGLALYHLGRHSEAVSTLTPLSVTSLGEAAVPWAGLGPDATLALAHHAAGDEEAARTVLAAIESSSDPFAAGLVRIGLSEVNEGFHSFARADEIGAWPCLAIHHLYRGVWDTVNNDPRHNELIAKAYRSWKLEPNNHD